MLRRMIKAGENFENPRTGTRMEVRESTPERVVFERLYPPDTGRADAHVHFDISQSWHVLEGTARMAIDGKTREVGEGELVEIAVGVKHQDIYNPHDANLRVRWTVEPVNDFVEAFADCYTHYLTHDELNKQDEFSPLQLFPILRDTKAQSWLTSMPIAVQKPVIRLGAAIGGLRGYRSSYGA